MKDIPHKNKSKSGGYFSIAGAIVFAVIAFFAYGAWTKSRVDDCLQSTYNAYDKQWAATCKSLAKKEKGHSAAPDCELPRFLSNDLNDNLQKDKNFCVNYG